MKRLAGQICNRGRGGRRGFRGGSTSRVKRVSTGTQAAGLSLGVLWGSDLGVRVGSPASERDPGCAAVLWLQVEEGAWGCDEGGVV
ncbi:MAG: hypothetical protein KTV45_15955 [Acidimicrobiia bacterium]|nr:hypothetical protein [Acidimicrobiia bacterium]